MKSLALEALGYVAVVVAACLFALFIMAPMEKTVISCAVIHGCQ
jgi:hypothetical protein